MFWSPNCLKFVVDAEYLSIRSKGTWTKSFLVLLACCKQIIQNQRKTERRVVTINVCWRKSSCELFPLATTHAKIANSGKMVIARYPIRYFSKKSVVTANATRKLACYSSSATHSDVLESFLSSQSHKPFEVESESSKIFSSQSRVRTWSSRVKSLRIIGLQTRVHVESNETSHFSMFFFMKKCRPTCYRMAPDK